MLEEKSIEINCNVRFTKSNKRLRGMLQMDQKEQRISVHVDKIKRIYSLKINKVKHNKAKKQFGTLGHHDIFITYNFSWNKEKYTRKKLKEHVELNQNSFSP